MTRNQLGTEAESGRNHYRNQLRVSVSWLVTLPKEVTAGTNPAKQSRLNLHTITSRFT